MFVQLFDYIKKLDTTKQIAGPLCEMGLWLIIPPATSIAVSLDRHWIDGIEELLHPITYLVLITFGPNQISYIYWKARSQIFVELTQFWNNCS